MSQGEEKFDRLARAIAGPISRRRSIGVFGGAVFAAAVAVVAPKKGVAGGPVTLRPVGPPCEHSMCCEGVKLTPGCDSNCCVEAICTLDPYCCNVEWDALCVEHVAEAPCLKDCSPVACGDSRTTLGTRRSSRAGRTGKRNRVAR